MRIRSRAFSPNREVGECRRSAQRAVKQRHSGGNSDPVVIPLKGLRQPVDRPRRESRQLRLQGRIECGATAWVSGSAFGPARTRHKLSIAHILDRVSRPVRPNGPARRSNGRGSSKTTPQPQSASSAGLYARCSEHNRESQPVLHGAALTRACTILCHDHRARFFKSYSIVQEGPNTFEARKYYVNIYYSNYSNNTNRCQTVSTFLLSALTPYPS
jgi:hypothetical protein